MKNHIKGSRLMKYGHYTIVEICYTIHIIVILETGYDFETNKMQD
jgi:hypothetical protein